MRSYNKHPVRGVITVIMIQSVSLYAACVTVEGSTRKTNRRLGATENYGLHQSSFS